MRISDWSSDVCSSDLGVPSAANCTVSGPLWIEIIICTQSFTPRKFAPPMDVYPSSCTHTHACMQQHPSQIRTAQLGRASCRERVCKYVSISVVAVSLQKQHRINRTQKTDSKKK